MTRLISISILTLSTLFPPSRFVEADLGIHRNRPSSLSSICFPIAITRTATRMSGFENIEHPTSNIEHPTSNIEHRMMPERESVRRSVFNVRRSMFFPNSPNGLHLDHCRNPANVNPNKRFSYLLSNSFEKVQLNLRNRATNAPSTLSVNGSNSRSCSNLKWACSLKNCFTTSLFSSGSRLHVL